MRNVKEVYEMVTQQTPPKPDALERQMKRQIRHTMNQRLGAFVVVAAIAGLAVLAGRASVGGRDHRAPAGSGPSGTVPGAPKVDYMLDLDTGVMTPLPDAILRSARESGQYAVFRGRAGSVLAYVGTSDGGSPQIFIANIDGTGIRQVTHDPTGATSPAWSPDGTKIAYVGSGSGAVRNLFVLDVATGVSTLITDGSRGLFEGDQSQFGGGLQFTPDGTSLVYTGGTDQQPVLRTVPIAGGNSTILIGPSGGLQDAGNGSLSPDGSLVTFQGGGFPLSDKPSFHCGPCRFVANADGTERRLVPGYRSNPAGTWSPDGSRIVDLACRGVENEKNCSPPHGVIVVDVATGHASRILALGIGAIWLDDHTLLIDV
jgi:Tol biopolymer transport system component